MEWYFIPILMVACFVAAIGIDMLQGGTAVKDFVKWFSKKYRK